MDYLKIILIISILWISGCSVSTASEKKNIQPKTMLDIYTQGTGQGKKDVSQFIENHLKEEKTFGYVKPYIPVMKEPVVSKIWIPDHKSLDNPDVMIAGHWNYMVIQPPMWFVENNVVNGELPVIVPTKQKSNEAKSYGTHSPAVRENI